MVESIQRECCVGIALERLVSLDRRSAGAGDARRCGR